MNDFAKDLGDYICSGHALLNVDTFEKDRAISIIREVGKALPEKRQIRIWSVSLGWVNDKVEKNDNYVADTPIQTYLEAIEDFGDNTICILKDFGDYLHHETYPDYDAVISVLDRLRKGIASVGQTIIFVGPGLRVPQPLLHDVTQVNFDLPTNDEIEERIRFACSDVVTPDGDEFELNQEILPKIINACKGMTSTQVADRTALALRRHKGLDHNAIQTIMKEKASIIRTSGLLEYIEPPEGGLSIVGGYDALKQHVLLDGPCFTEEARRFGIEYPRGILLVGIPGCGKTLISLAIASELNLPLISLDVGNLMNKYVGESEANMREALKMLERIAPCVLQLDEIEKGFGGAGDRDGGASRRVFGSFIKWMNDRKSPVYIVATANQVQSLPPEFCRKGRMDELYGLDLPGETERQQIFRIHITKRGRDPLKFDIARLAKLTIGFTGADVEQVVKMGLKKAFSDSKKLRTKHMETCVEEIIPLSKSEGDRIEGIREWCKKHTKPANPQIKDTVVRGNTRKVSIS